MKFNHNAFFIHVDEVHPSAFGSSWNNVIINIHCSSVIHSWKAV